LLTADQIDHFKGMPMDLHRKEEGVMVYSVGPDGVDDGGNLGEDFRRAGTDLGFRLWDVAQRHGPPHEWIPSPRRADAD
jgi:hypothetical protein